MSGLRIAGYNFPVWLIIVIMTGAGSLTISSSSIVDTESTLIETDVPNVQSRVATGAPVQFDKSNLVNLDVSGHGVTVGAHAITSQKVKINLLVQIAEPVTITVPIMNHSPDTSIVMLKVIAPQEILVDVEEGFSTGGVRLVGSNTWIMAVDDNAFADFKLDIVAMKGGAFFLLVEISSIG